MNAEVGTRNAEQQGKRRVAARPSISVPRSAFRVPRSCCSAFRVRTSAFSLSSQHFPQVLQQSVKQLVRTAPSIDLAEQPGFQALGLPHVLHRYFGGAALELEGEEGAGAAAAADLDPAVGVGRVVVDDLDFDVDAAAVPLEEDAVAVA